MTVSLESLTTCFQGLLPAQLFTCSADGIPNAAYLSHVDYVDSTHVALAPVLQQEPPQHHGESAGARVRARSGHGTGMEPAAEIRPFRDGGAALRSDGAADRGHRVALRPQGIFKLRAADVYEVLHVEPVAEEAGTLRPESHVAAAAAASPIFTINALQTLSERIHRADSLETLVDSILLALEESFGFSHSMFLVPAEEKDVLVTIATRGYPGEWRGSRSPSG